MDLKTSLWPILRDQFQHHAGMQREDLYKLLVQAACGGEHLFTDGGRVLALLRNEWAGLGEDLDGEVLLENIDPRGEFVRVNMRVYRDLGGTPEILSDVFSESWRDFQMDLKIFIEYAGWAVEGCRAGLIPVDAQKFEDFIGKRERNGFPPVHHSKSYIRFNRPAYRVVRKSVWEKVALAKKRFLI